MKEYKKPELDVIDIKEEILLTSPGGDSTTTYKPIATVTRTIATGP